MLYVVATPIGNLSDITYRAIEVLKSVDMIACEDTRKTKILTNHYQINTPLSSYYSYNQFVKGEYFLELLKKGKQVALVSEAGTPGISDPGNQLVKAAIESGIEVVSIPGPSAVIAALSVSGLSTNKFFFEGFLPIKKGPRCRRLVWLANLGVTIVIYESPHRILKTLENCNEVLGNRKISLARELTKKFEEVIIGTPSSLIERFSQKKPKGEFVLLF